MFFNKHWRHGPRAGSRPAVGWVQWWRGKRQTATIQSADMWRQSRPRPPSNDSSRPKDHKIHRPSSSAPPAGTFAAAAKAAAMILHSTHRQILLYATSSAAAADPDSLCDSGPIQTTKKIFLAMASG